MTKLVVEVDGEEVQEGEQSSQQQSCKVPKEVVKEVPQKPSKTEFKKITDLNDEEKKKIIADIQAGKESEHYELKEFKNGTFRIVKKKQPTIVEKAVTNTKSKDKTDPDKVFLTNDQLINQRIIELEVKYAKLENKYKKQKKRVNDIYENLEEEVVIPQSEIQSEPAVKEESQISSKALESSTFQPPRVLSLRALRFKRY